MAKSIKPHIIKGKHYHKPQLAGASGHVKNKNYIPKQYYFKRITKGLLAEIESAICLVVDENGGNKEELKQILYLKMYSILNCRAGTLWNDSMKQEGEKWKRFPHQKDYLVSNKGRVRSLKTNKLLSHQKRNQFGHIIISVSNHGIVHNIGVHNLVLMTFVGPRPTPTHVGMHLDNNPQNNEVSNLKWGTCQDNVLQAYNEGRLVPPIPPHPSGVNHPRAVSCHKYKDGDLVRVYDTLIEAAIDNSIPKTTMRRKMAKGEKINGFVFKCQKLAA